jgi:hypothetical protein
MLSAVHSNHCLPARPQRYPARVRGKPKADFAEALIGASYMAAAYPHDAGASAGGHARGLRAAAKLCEALGLLEPGELTCWLTAG